MGGTHDPRINVASNLVALCRSCHALIESRRDWAIGEGWLVPRTTRADPATVSIATGLHGRVWFGDDGSVTPTAGSSRDDPAGRLGS
jgi:hypothetical protein